QSMTDRLGARPVPIQIPIGAEGDFVGVVDLVEMKAHIWAADDGSVWNTVEIPAELKDSANEWRGKMIEACADVDDKLLEKYLEELDISPDEVRSAVRAATLQQVFVPVLCGSAFKNKGVQPLLDAVIDYLPSPVDLPPIQGFSPKDHDEAMDRRPSDDEPFSALAFKIMSDPHVGKLTYFRVYSGRASKGDAVLNSTTNKTERIGRLLRMHANHREDIDDIFTGDIVAAVGLKNASTGDTLSDAKNAIQLEAMTFPAPVIAVAIEPKTKIDQEKLGGALARLAEEDPTFLVRSDEETGQTIISGMGELHLEVLVDRLTREFKVAANIGRPQVAYRETIKKAVEKVEGKYVRQTGGRGQYGHVVISLEPTGPGGGYEFIDATKGGNVPKEYVSSVDAGIEGALDAGILAGYPVVDVRAILIDGSSHAVDSSEMAFKIAGSMALQAAAKRAGMVLLEPMMEVEVVTPEEYMGEVIGDLNSRRGRVESMEQRGNAHVVAALAPLAQMFGYSTDLRSLSQGRANYTMQFHSYEQVPASVAEEIVSATTGE
ncbi:MAG: elongation factor G, partial [Acidimicrobiia bacterium]|nr:elongation factor G [Acidimicrobiia bacterium]